MRFLRFVRNFAAVLAVAVTLVHGALWNSDDAYESFQFVGVDVLGLEDDDTYAAGFEVMRTMLLVNAVFVGIALTLHGLVVLRTKR